MELKEIFKIIKRRLLLLIITVAVFVAGSIYFTFSNKDSYETSAMITVEATRENTNQYQYSGYYSIQSSDLFINTILGWIKSQNIVSEIYTKAGISFDSKDTKALGKKIYSQKVPPQNIVLTISNEDKENSKKIALATIDVIKEKTTQMALVANSSATFEILNSQPITTTKKPNLLLNVLIAFAIAIILSVFAIFAIEYISPTVNGGQRVRSIFKKDFISLKGMNLKKLFSLDSKESEKFRFIRANIVKNPNEKFVTIVSGINEQSVTPIVAANIALSFARAGKKTILIDSDFSTPVIHEFFDKKNETGFSEFLFDEKNINKYLQSTNETNLHIISSGVKLSYASDTIERSNVASILEELKKVADVIILNVPSLNSSSEAFPLFNFIKESVLVIKTGKTNISAANYINKFLEEKNVDKNIIVL